MQQTGSGRIRVDPITDLHEYGSVMKVKVEILIVLSRHYNLILLRVHL